MFTHLNRSIILTGNLAPPIIINGSDPLRPLSYSVQMNQSIDLGPLYLQGGPAKWSSNFKNKNVEGSLSIYPRITQNTILETGAVDLISAAQNYNNPISLTTLLIPYNPKITASSSVFNISSSEIYSLIFDTCLVKKFTIKVSENEDVKIDCEIIGQVDEANSEPIPSANNPINYEGLNLYRQLAWFDCFFQRNGSALENVSEVEISITKDIDQPVFLFPAGTTKSFDSVFYTGVKSLYVSFKYKERVTSVFDLFNYSFGGWLDGANFTGNFGPISFSIPNALYRVSSQQLSGDIIERTTEGFYRMEPNTADANNFLFTIS